MSKLPGIDVLEEATVLHGLIGLGMDLTRTLQSFVVILLIVTTTSRFLDHVDLVIVFAGMLASIITVIIGLLITIISVVAIVVTVAPTFTIVVLTTVISFIVSAQWVLGA
jgi:hypothetical protein